MRVSKFAVAPALAAVVAAGFAISASGQSTTDPASGTRTLVASGGSFHAVDAKPKGESAGDYFTLSQNVTENGSKVGTVDAVATQVTKKDVQYEGTLLLSDGKVMVAGAGKGSAKTTVLAIVGGTGPYAGAGGTFTTVDHGKTTNFTLTFDK